MARPRRVVNQGRVKQWAHYQNQSADEEDDDDDDNRGRRRGRQNENLLSSSGKPLEMRTIILMTTLTDSICRIDTGTHTGTGYMVRIPIGQHGELYGMLTNNHVLGNSQLNSGNRWNLEFTAMNGLNYDWNSSDWVYMFTNKRLDCTFVVPQPSTVDELDENGIDFMPVGVERVGERVGVIQHPQGGELSFSYGKIVRVDNADMYHNADTMSGSSGSPLINSKGEVVGLHKAWEEDRNLNLATRISTVVNAIRTDFCNQPNLGIARKDGPNVNRDPRTGKTVTTDPSLALRVSRGDPPLLSRGGGGSGSSHGHTSSRRHHKTSRRRHLAPLRFSFFDKAHESSFNTDQAAVDDDDQDPAEHEADPANDTPQPCGAGPGMPIPDYWSQPYSPQGGQQQPRPGKRGEGPARLNIGWAV